ncbi:DUF7527 domain-containing protein [Halapricum desulfuricans]|uniref:DUF7527 domain-containing protein n=1 Tax=Halapricum desulfuricans TaxID=2841257 RepID=A0A897ND70_9EURY|nr:hypothetical protein [Halapricum desulfuricans]QSG08346.1 Uncharacterized protein HSR122_0942 [Halapricum desulfuricans]
MTTRAAEQVDEWESRPFTDGYEQLRTLADQSFSGAVTTGRATLYMIEGTAVDILDGTITDFEDATGTVHKAPTPALPLLAVMQERGDEVRAKYYSEETALHEVDRKLSEGGFTGHVELSENVLSGDYYVVYQAGKSMSVAFLGESGQLASGDEAFERADDEVGIYEVRPVDIDPIELPDPPAAETDSTSGDDEDRPTGDESAETGPSRADDTDSGASDPSQDDDESETDDRTRRDERPRDTGDSSSETADDPPSSGTVESASSSEATDDPPSSGTPEGRDRTVSAEPRQETKQTTRERRHEDDSARREEATEGATSTALERRTIPSVDPDRTWTPDGETADDSRHEQHPETDAARQATSARRQPDRQHAEHGGQPDRQRAASSDAGAEIADLEARIEELEASRSELRTERDELQAELKQVRQERDDLQEEVQRLRTEVADLEDRLEAADEPAADDSQLSQSSTTGPSLTPREAIAGTNLFVRYGSRSDATLSSAHDGEVDAAAVDANLSLEHHTEFDDSEATVEGEPFESFLQETIHYQFVEWLVHELLYEIRDTGHRKVLEDLYDAIPKIDRVQLAGTVTVDGDEATPQEESFDVVVRDRMGNPLVVTNLDDSRTATTEEMMTGLVTAATRAGEAHERLAGAVFVTSSFFEPDALKTAAEATGGGILSRDKRESFVRLSRKGGFHLCLVESRDGGFHLSVPEL